MNDHDTKVARLAEEVKCFYKAGKPFRIFHGSTNSTRILSFKRGETIDVSDLDRVLDIDTAGRTAWVEPNVPMDALVQATLRHGLVPQVVMEFPGLTVGGGVQGGAGESSSFRYGCFNETCNRYEMILADGSTVQASPRQNADLFYGTAGSFGTLGIITAAEIRLVPATDYVQLTYLPVSSFQEAVDMLKKVSREAYDYIDGIMFGKDNGVIIVGSLSDHKAGKIRRFTRAFDQWYFLHAETISLQRQQVTETVPLRDYLFRYDRGAFWVGRYAFEFFSVPFSRLTRWLFNPFFHTRKMYEALQASGVSQQFIVQDLALPEDKAVPFMDFVDKHLGIYPLWLCPLKPDAKSPFQSNNLKTLLAINVGVWGNRLEDREEFIAANRSIEKKVRALAGKKWFYAHSYYTETEFWNSYDRKDYERLRRKYHATSLPDIYDKISVKEYHPVDLKGGVLRAIQGKAKLRIRD